MMLPNPRAIPDAYYEKIKALGKRFDPEVAKETYALLVPLHQGRDDSGLTIIRDVAYGPDAERNLLDVFTPDARPSAGLPVVMFFHGGGYTGGDKNVSGDAVFGNIAGTYARNGIVGVICTYRLAPGAQWPEGARDVGTALAYMREHAAEFGGDPDKIFLMGHSAGAQHVASYVFRGDHHPPDGPGCKGVILMSGQYTMAPEGPHPYFGDDPDSFADKGVLGHVAVGDLPVMLTVAEFDLFRYEQNLVRLAHELVTKFGAMPRIKQLLGHNHVSQALTIGTGDTTLAPDLIDFVHTHGS